MHDYLQAIGFDRSMTRKEMEKLVQQIIANPDEVTMYESKSGEKIMQYDKGFSPVSGISVVGIENAEDDFFLEYIYPYALAKNYFYHEDIQVEKYADRDAFAGICDDVNLGVPLIFYINNGIHYLNMNQYKEIFPSVNTVMLSALSLEGRIILNVEKDESQIRKEEKSSRHRHQLLEAAREGDPNAIEILTLDDMDTYHLVSRRSKKEDLFTIVDSYCIPYGVETDKYSILGTIIDVNEFENERTGKSQYYLSVVCNDLEIDVCINKEDLLGEPLKGRRFKGVVWLQGMIDYI